MQLPTVQEISRDIPLWNRYRSSLDVRIGLAVQGMQAEEAVKREQESIEVVGAESVAEVLERAKQQSEWIPTGLPPSACPHNDRAGFRLRAAGVVVCQSCVSDAGKPDVKGKIRTDYQPHSGVIVWIADCSNWAPIHPSTEPPPPCMFEYCRAKAAAYTFLSTRVALCINCHRYSIVQFDNDPKRFTMWDNHKGETLYTKLLPYYNSREK